MTPTRPLLLLVAGLATCYFIAAVPTQGNWRLPLAVLLLVLGGYFWADHEHRRREAQRRAQMAAYRAQWFASFDRRRRMRGAR